MSMLSSCPKCAKQVTVPGSAEPADMVRCPLCHSEYMLAEALANAPPELLVLRTLAVVGRAEPHTAHVADTDLNLFDDVSTDLADSPTLDLPHDEPLVDHSEEPTIQLTADERYNGHAGEKTAAASLADDEPAFGHDEPALADDEPALGHDEPALSDTFAATEHELADTTSEPAPEAAFDMDEEPMSFDLGSDADAPVIDEDLPTEDAPLADFGDEHADVPSLDEPADDEAAVPVGVAHDAAEIAPAAEKPKRRKPSLLAGLIIWSTSLPVAAVLAYAILLWAAKMDPLHIAPKLPSFLVPSALAAGPKPNPGQMMAQAPPKAPQQEENPSFATNVPPLTPRNPAQPADGDEDSEDATEAPAVPRKTPVKPVAPADEEDEEAMPEEDEDVPAAKPPVKAPIKKPIAKAPADDDEDTMAEEPGEVATDDDTAKPADEMPEDEDVATTEPVKVPGDDVAAPEEETEPVAAAHVGPTDDVHYTADELDQSLTDAHDAAAALSAADKDAVKKAKAQYYRKLYQLAETTTFVAPEAGAAADTAKVRELLDEVAADPASFGEIGKAAGKWIAIAKGKEHQGVVLAGTVQSVAKQGQVYETKVLLSDGTQAVSVLGA